MTVSFFGFLRKYICCSTRFPANKTHQLALHFQAVLTNQVIEKQLEKQKPIFQLRILGEFFFNNLNKFPQWQGSHDKGYEMSSFGTT